MIFEYLIQMPHVGAHDHIAAHRPAVWIVTIDRIQDLVLGNAVGMLADEFPVAEAARAMYLDGWRQRAIAAGADFQARWHLQTSQTVRPTVPAETM